MTEQQTPNPQSTEALARLEKDSIAALKAVGKFARGFAALNSSLEGTADEDGEPINPTAELLAARRTYGEAIVAAEAMQRALDVGLNDMPESRLDEIDEALAEAEEA